MLTPGEINLNDLKFSTAGESPLIEIVDNDDGDLTEPENGDGDGGNRRGRRVAQEEGGANVDAGVVLYSTQVDVAVFHLVSTSLSVQPWFATSLYSMYGAL